MLIIALLPFIAIIFFLIIQKWPAIKAMPASLAVTLITAYIWGMKTQTIITATIKGACITIEIMFLIFGAILLLEILKKAGAMNTLTNTIQKITKDHRIMIIIIAVTFVALIEGAAGFGTPAALAAPILTHLGVTGTTAVSTSLTGDTIPTTYGALGTPIIYGIGTSYPALITEVSKTTAKIMFFLGAILPLLTTTVLIKTHKGKLKNIIEIIPFALAVGIITMISYYLVAQLSVQLPAIISGITGITTAIILTKTRLAPKTTWQIKKIPKPTKTKISVTKALIPYIILSTLLIITGIETIRAWLKKGAITTKIHTFYLFAHPFILFLITSIIAISIYKLNKKQTKETLKTTIKRAKTPFIALLSVLILVQILQYSHLNVQNNEGILQTIAHTIKLPGTLYLLISPFIGIFGSFVAGSNTVSNLLFSTIQHQTAINAGINPIITLSLQTIGGAVGNMIAIHNIIAAAAVIGLFNKETKILKINLIPVLLLGTLAGIIGLIIHLMT